MEYQSSEDTTASHWFATAHCTCCANTARPSFAPKTQSRPTLLGGPQIKLLQHALENHGRHFQNSACFVYVVSHKFQHLRNVAFPKRRERLIGFANPFVCVLQAAAPPTVSQTRSHLTRTGLQMLIDGRSTQLLRPSFAVSFVQCVDGLVSVDLHIG